MESTASLVLLSKLQQRQELLNSSLLSQSRVVNRAVAFLAKHEGTLHSAFLSSVSLNELILFLQVGSKQNLEALLNSQYLSERLHRFACSDIQDLTPNAFLLLWQAIEKAFSSKENDFALACVPLCTLVSVVSFGVDAFPQLILDPCNRGFIKTFTVTFQQVVFDPQNIRHIPLLPIQPFAVKLLHKLQGITN